MFGRHGRPEIVECERGMDVMMCWPTAAMALLPATGSHLAAVGQVVASGHVGAAGGAGRVGGAHLLDRLADARGGGGFRSAGTSASAQLTDVTLNPQPTQLPGGTALQNLTNGLGGWALILSLVGLLIGAASWALGAHTQNYQQSFFGRRAVLVSGLAALLIGAAPALINFFFHTGLSVH
ncbi:MAG: DUF6112 family protein [Actinomycetota bacterium]|jgi:hypothetical protein|nr:DUF6112 family protein [Actinomycetota bacterium]